MLEIFTFIIAVILILLMIGDWTATIILRHASNLASDENIALRERATMAFVLALSSTLNSVLAMIRLADVHPGTPITLVILSTSLILGSVPNLYWLSLYFTNRLRK